MSVEAYREAIVNNETNRSRDAHEIEKSYRIRFDEGPARHQLSGLIHDELQDHIVKGQIAIPTEITGDEEGEWQSVSDLVDKLVEVSVVWGPERATELFYDAQLEQMCSYRDFILVDGLMVEREYELADGVRILPPRESILPEYVPYWAISPWRNRVVDNSAVLMIEGRVGPRFSSPSEIEATNTREENSTTRGRRIESAADFDYEMFCMAASLVVGTDVALRKWWRYVPHTEIGNTKNWGSRMIAEGIGVRHRGSMYEVRPRPGRRMREERMRAIKKGGRNLVVLEEADEVRQLYGRLAALEEEAWDWLSVPIERWRSSVYPKESTDLAIDLGIALESLYLPKVEQELSFQMRLRGAWHLRSSPVERREVLETFGALYKMRSSAVHDGRLKGKRYMIGQESLSEEDVLEAAKELCREALIKAICSGEPDWEKLVLGYEQ